MISTEGTTWGPMCVGACIASRMGTLAAEIVTIVESSLRLQDSVSLSCVEVGAIGGEIKVEILTFQIRPGGIRIQWEEEAGRLISIDPPPSMSLLHSCKLDSLLSRFGAATGEADRTLAEALAAVDLL